MDKVAQSIFFGYKDMNTGWSVPSRTHFTVREIKRHNEDGSFDHSELEFRWEHVAAGFGKRPTQIGEVHLLLWNEDEPQMRFMVQHTAECLARNCIKAYILWCASQDKPLNDYDDDKGT
jgi:hypothetical protein